MISLQHEYFKMRIKLTYDKEFDMVKKTGMALLCATILSTSLIANEGVLPSKAIIGLEIGSSTIQANNIYSPIIGGLDHRGQNIQLGFRIGAENKEWKTLLVANYFDSPDDDQRYIKGHLEINYFILQESVIRPLMGLNVGYMNYQTSNIDENGFIYGGQIGVQYDAMENLSLDLMYRYSLVATDNVDSIAGIIFGINYVY